MDGTEFDSSHKRGQPAEFKVTGVIKGWTEALLLMKPGAKWKLFIPPALAYGRQAPPSIPPNSLLVFEVELLNVKPAPEESVQAVSGEIIKVPSAEELKKGAKIEVLKEEDVKKLQQQQQQTNTAKPK
jgi:FKBP-type peptidyl-prolyl cis-trans isomerase 2